MLLEVKELLQEIPNPFSRFFSLSFQRKMIDHRKILRKKVLYENVSVQQTIARYTMIIVLVRTRVVLRIAKLLRLRVYTKRNYCVVRFLIRYFLCMPNTYFIRIINAYLN